MKNPFKKEKETNTLPLDGEKREETFYPYFIYSITDNKMIGNMLLTEDQAYQLNIILKNNNNDISFIRMW